MDWSLVVQEWKLLPHVIVTILSNPSLILTVFLGAVLGLVVGMLPGLSAVMAMSLLMGFVFKVPADVGFGLLIAIYVGAMAAGGVTAIMVNIPGTPAAAATVMDGFPMAKAGRAKEAVEASFSASFVGEILGEGCTLLLLPFIAVAALKLGDWEIFLVALLGITLAGALSGDNPLKGWISAFIGIVIAMVGMDEIWAYPRFGYTAELQRGFNFVPALIGLFGMAEVFMVLKSHRPYQITGEGGWIFINFRLIGRYFVTILRSVLVAIGIGIVPGVGESAACWVGYEMARKRSRNRANFGKGEVEGVIASEAANSATSGGALIPTLIFGIPGSGPTAILMAAMFMYGIRPGPMLMIEQPGFVAEVVCLFWLSAICSRLGGIILSPAFIHILSSPREIVLPVAAALGVLGAWAAGFTLFDVYCMLGFGVLGFFLRLRNYPLAPMVLGILVGKIADTALRRALITYGDNYLGMLIRPFSIIMLAFLIFTVYSQVKPLIVKPKGEPGKIGK
ncbi:tripartite tricarboxylate transporter permease [Thermodesulforhabdus norvegica]|uniref:Putative tricarboxylic transport membrane protein n=1 Tax=Thermodesulforhabdus norvegica TaxID=39841 RepID=A0A1I4R3T6_9BACT|nr:tripartite tricarboxylate transporter permease [Thermodesulforhabdus norvegica]SFM46600.1 putative tricarboxylic transport membrane protein [Thermodesulforhabdus norvegica]